jgi:hypothetical protein
MSSCCNSPVLLPPVGQSDHNSVLWSFNKNTAKYGTSKVKTRQGSNYDRRAFGKWLADINWNNLYRAESCEQKLDFFQYISPNIFRGRIFFLPLIITAYSNLRLWLSYSYRQRRSRDFQSEEAEN